MPTIRVTPEQFDELLALLPGAVAGRSVADALRDMPAAAPAAPPPAPEPSKLVEAAVVCKRDIAGAPIVLIALIPVATASEANGRDWRARSKRSNAAWRAVSRTLGPHLRDLGIFATAYHAGQPLLVTFARLGGRKLDRGNVANALKGTEDAVAFMLGADDGDDRWKSEYVQHPGGPVGVRVEIEVVA